MTDVMLLGIAWGCNALLALTGALYYAGQIPRECRLVRHPAVREDAAVQRVAQRRLFRSCSRLGLKILFTLFCALRTYIAVQYSPSPVSAEQWLAGALVTILLLWLSADTIIARSFD